MNKIILPSSYHNFADKRKLLGIDNTLNVSSNVFILLPALYLLQKKKKPLLLSSHIISLFIVSSYYHLHPTNKSIMPDMISVVLLNIVVLSFFIDTQYFILLYIVGILSVIYWKYTNDLRLYIALLIGCPLYVFYKLYDNKSVRQELYTILSLGIVSRLVEHNDTKVYKLLNNTVSGHTLKHTLSGLQIWYIIRLREKLDKI